MTFIKLLLLAIFFPFTLGIVVIGDQLTSIGGLSHLQFSLFQTLRQLARLEKLGSTTPLRSQMNHSIKLALRSRRNARPSSEGYSETVEAASTEGERTPRPNEAGAPAPAPAPAAPAQAQYTNENMQRITKLCVDLYL